MYAVYCRLSPRDKWHKKGLEAKRVAERERVKQKYKMGKGTEIDNEKVKEDGGWEESWLPREVMHVTSQKEVIQ